MTDIIDRAQEHTARELEQSLRMQAAVAAGTVRPRAAGHCLNSECVEPFDGDRVRLFCGPACAERYETQSKLKRHQG